MPPTGHNEADTRAKLIDPALHVFDLKAVNPREKMVLDQRTPTQLLADIEAKGREVDSALQRLNELFTAPCRPARVE